MSNLALPHIYTNWYAQTHTIHKCTHLFADSLAHAGTCSCVFVSYIVFREAVAFTVVTEEALAAGVRRIVAVTGKEAVQALTNARLLVERTQKAASVRTPCTNIIDHTY